MMMLTMAQGPYNGMRVKEDFHFDWNNDEDIL